jgi:hypothetical protein
MLVASWKLRCVRSRRKSTPWAASRVTTGSTGTRAGKTSLFQMRLTHGAQRADELGRPLEVADEEVARPDLLHAAEAALAEPGHAEAVRLRFVPGRGREDIEPVARRGLIHSPMLPAGAYGVK